MTAKFVYYQEDHWWIGWLADYPDYRTQGESFEELQSNLREIYADLASGDIPFVPQVS